MVASKRKIKQIFIKGWRRKVRLTSTFSLLQLIAAENIPRPIQIAKLSTTFSRDILNFYPDWIPRIDEESAIRNIEMFPTARYPDNENKEDLFNRLTDDIVCDVISRLSSMDAVRTGVLSKRWTDLWRQADLKKLKFEAPCMQEPGTLNFMNKVDKFFEIRSGCEIESLTISCYLPASDHYMHRAIEWVHFGRKNNVQRLDLNFSAGNTEREFLLPLWSNQNKIEFNAKHLSLTAVDIRCRWVSFNSLITLTLKRCPVDPYMLVDIVTKCMSLEGLTLEECNLSDCDHFGDIQKEPFWLKHLSILNCVGMKKVDVSEAKCLLSLKYDGDMLDELVYGSNGVTVKSVSLNVSNYDPKHLHCLSNAFPHLETLSLHQPFTHGNEILPTFSSIKNFELTLVHEHPENLWPQISNTLKASPSLQKLELHFPRDHGENRPIKKMSFSSADCQHVHLKEVLLYNFRRQAREVELIMHIINCGSRSMEKMRIYKQDCYTSLAETQSLKIPRSAAIVDFDPFIEFLSPANNFCAEIQFF